MMRLSDCVPGQSGTIREIHGDGPIVQRLMEMGFIQGSGVKVVRVAPLGDPMEIEISGYMLSLRKTEAEKVEIDT